MIRAALISTLVLTGAPAGAGPNKQLLRSIEFQLRNFNLGEIDYDALTTTQAAALHFKLSNQPAGLSAQSASFRNELLVILRWDGRERNHSIDKSD